MIELGGKKLCENCFGEISSQPCPHCGFDPSVPSADPTVLAPGSILLGKYIIGRTIGKGGFGITYLAYDTTAGRKVAIKEFYPYGLAVRTNGNPTVAVTTEDNANVFKAGAERFYEEAKLVSRFNGNPNIVAVHEFFYENDTVYFAMEYLSGNTLKDHIQKNGTLNAGQALFIAQNVSNALMVAHSASVLHRDISPDNIMLCSNGEVKIIDFGAARQVMAERSQTFSVILKPGFAPLEQYQKKGKQGPWTDIYSLGATLYYALTGEIPDDPMSRQEEDSTFGENRFGINEELWNIIVRATMLKSSDRYQDIFELRKDLNSVSFAPELIVMPKAQETSPQEGFRTAMPFGKSTATVTRTQAEVPVSTPNAAPEKNNSGFFAAHKKPLIAAISGTAAVAAAAVMIAVALNSGGQTSDGMIHDPEYSQGSYVPLDDTTYSSLPETTTTATTTKADEKPVESEPEEQTSEPAAVTTTTPKTTPKTTPEPEVESEPEVTTPATTTTTRSTQKPKPEVESKPEVTKPVTTTTTTAKPVESKPEEVKYATICGQKISTDITELRIVQRSRDDQTFLNGILYCDPPTNKEDFAQLKYMKNLEKLELLEMGSVTDLSFLEGMPKLTDLTIENDNQITDISAIGKLTNLKKLSLSDFQKLSDISVLGKLTQLETLSLRALSKVNDLSSLGTLTNLKDFRTWDVPYNNISFLKKMTNLTYLAIDYTNIDGTIKDISVLSNLKNLDYLSLTNLPITDISVLSELKKLTRLNMTSCSNVKSFTPLSKLKSLTFLRLFRNKITDPSFAYGLTNLETLWLTGEINDRFADKNVIADCDMKTLKSKLPNCDVH